MPDSFVRAEDWSSGHWHHCPSPLAALLPPEGPSAHLQLLDLSRSQNSLFSLFGPFRLILKPLVAPSSPLRVSSWSLFIHLMFFLSQKRPSLSPPAQQLMPCAQPRRYLLTGTFPVLPTQVLTLPAAPQCPGLTSVTSLVLFL